MGEGEESAGGDGRTRRGVLTAVGGAVGLPLGLGQVHRSKRAAEDSDGDGIPDHRKESVRFHRRLERLYGAEQFSGLERGRKDFLVDARYVGDAHVDERVKRRLERLFRDNGIHMQWLDYPTRYDRERMEREYGRNVRRLLWARNSFYRREVEDDLKNVAFQLVVVPGKPEAPNRNRLYSPWADHTPADSDDGWLNGMNVGNRAAVADFPDPREQTRLILHEIAHLAVCHDDDPSNRGVMGTQQEVDLTDEEWRRLRDGLDAVHDATGYDVAFNPCLWLEHLTATCDGCG